MSNIDDIPIGGGGSYNINWDELENMDPSMAIPSIRKSSLNRNNSALVDKPNESSLHNQGDNVVVENDEPDTTNLVLPPPPPTSQLSVDSYNSVRNSVCDFPSPPSPHTMESSILNNSENEAELNNTLTYPLVADLPENSEVTQIKTSSFSVDSGLDNSPNEMNGKSLASSGYESIAQIPNMDLKKPNLQSESFVSHEAKDMIPLENNISETKPNYPTESSQPNSETTDEVMNLSQDSLSDQFSYSRVRRNTYDKIEAAQNVTLSQKDFTSSFTSHKETNSSQDSFMSTNEESPTEADSSVYASVSSNINVISVNADNCNNYSGMVKSLEDQDLTPKPSLPHTKHFANSSCNSLQQEDSTGPSKKNSCNALDDMIQNPQPIGVSFESSNLTSDEARIQSNDQASQTVLSIEESHKTSEVTSISAGIQTEETLAPLQTGDLDSIKAKFLMENEGDIQTIEEKWKEQVASLQEENRSLSNKVTELNSTIVEMTRCVKEYEHTLSQVAEDKTRVEIEYEQSYKTLVTERDQALEDVFTMEKAFGDLHRRFEKTKQVIDSFKQNEEQLNKYVADHQEKLKRRDQKYETLKQHAEEKLKLANDEISELRRTKESEITRLHAALKMAELQEASLQSQLNQKVVENNELTKICDELISKCGT